MVVWSGWSTGARVAGVGSGAALVAVLATLLWPPRPPETQLVEAASAAATLGQAPSLAPVPDAEGELSEVASPDAEGVAPEAEGPEVAQSSAPEAEVVAVAEGSAPEAEVAAVAEGSVPEAEVVAVAEGSASEAEVAAVAEGSVPEAEVAAVAQSSVPEAETTAEAPAEPAVPSFDSYRVEADGSAVVSGRADPLAKIRVLVDGVAVAEATAGADGSFAALFTLEPNPAPSLMTLEVVTEAGDKRVSTQSVALGPIAGPQAQTVIAAVAPEEAVDAGTPPVAEPVPPVALLVTDDGATVAQEPAQLGQEAGGMADAPPAAAQLLETISYTPVGAVHLSGKGQVGQAVRIYLDEAPVADAPVDPTGVWQATLGDTEPKIYTLRVDQIDSAGVVTARIETPFKRETLETLAALTEPVAQEGVAPSAPQPAAAAAVVSTADISAESAAPAAQSVAAEGLVEAPAEPQPQDAPDAAPAQSLPVSASAGMAPAQGEAEDTLAPSPATLSPAPVSITVQPGFTLWSIARERFGDGVLYVQVFEANRDKIRDPDLIYPGQVFAIPQKP